MVKTLGLVIRLTHIPRDTDDLFTRSHGRTPARGRLKVTERVKIIFISLQIRRSTKIPVFLVTPERPRVWGVSNRCLCEG